MPIPSCPFDPAESLFAGLSIVQLKIAETVLVFEATQLDDDPEQETKYLDRPNTAGRLSHRRAVETKAFEKWTFGLDEVKRLLDIFGGKMRGRKVATCTLWLPDPDDAAGLVALKSQDDFACVVTRDGKVTHGNQDFSKSTIKIESMEADDVSWTKDAVTTSS